MKSAVYKSPIPHTHAFIVKRLKESVFDPTWHFHSEYQIFIVLSGKGTRFIGDSITPYQQGDITFTGPNLPHLWKSDIDHAEQSPFETSEGVVVYFNESLIGSHLLQKEETIKLKQLFKKSLRGIEITGATAGRIENKLLKLLKLEGFTGVLELMGILDLLSQSDDLKILASPGYTNTLKEGDTQRMNTVYAYIMKHFKQKITITELAVLTNMTPTSFSRYFKTHANKTFSEFITEIRIGHACKMLIDKKMNASQACYASGYQTLSNFNKQFKALTQRTPTAYIKEFAY